MKNTKSLQTNFNTNNLEQFALHFFAYDGNAAEISVNIANGADPNKADADGMTPLHFAALSGQIDAVGALLKAGADATAMTNDRCTPADMARHNKHDNLAIALDHIAKHQKKFASPTTKKVFKIPPSLCFWDKN